jgi:hypothetical protein
MKKVTMLVPDTMIYVDEVKDKNFKDQVNTDKQNIELALTTNDYHINYYFPEGSIKVISIEECKE